MIDPTHFGPDLLSWFAEHAREMPWRESKDPYRIWISEIMLQQTQVNTVRPYFQRFVEAFPSVQALAAAPLDSVLKRWEGLGYYSRARNLHKGAQYVVEHFGGVVPADPVQIREIPGIGPYSAGAILSIAYNLPEPAVDGNVIRVFSRLDAIATPFDGNKPRQALETRVRALIPSGRAGDFNQALMELGALVCSPRQPDCGSCPVATHCQARAAGEPERYPVKGKVTQVKAVTLTVAWIEEAGRLLIHQQDGSGIFKGLWGFPLIQDLPFAHQVRGQLGSVQHTLTHRQLTLEICAVSAEVPAELPPGWAWIDPDHNPDYAIPVAHQKVLGFVREHPLLLAMLSE
ncbi:MAG: A/G-specific adenine glycosylase [Candidatus Sericytochromatia bacterium]